MADKLFLAMFIIFGWGENVSGSTKLLLVTPMPVNIIKSPICLLVSDVAAKHLYTTTHV